MVLQADVAVPRMRFVGDVEFVLCAVGPLVRFSEFVEVDGIDLLAVEDDGDIALVASDLDVVPLTGRLGGIDQDGREVVDVPVAW